MGKNGKSKEKMCKKSTGTIMTKCTKNENLTKWTIMRKGQQKHK